MSLEEEGLPLYISLDPYEFYRSSAISHRKKAVGFEKLVYDVFGSNVIATLSFYLDVGIKIPKIPRMLYESPIREREFFHGPRRSSNPFKQRIRSRSNYRIPFSTKYYPLIDSWESISNATGTVSASTADYSSPSATPVELIPSFTKDTIFSTRSQLTRKWGGPFEKFHPYYSIPPLTLKKRSYSTVKYIDTLQESDSTTERTMTIDNYCRLTTSAQNDQLALERARCTAEMSKHLPSMLSGILPDASKFDLSRSIAELKDFRTTRNPVEIIKDLREKLKSVKGNSDLYLAEQFGVLPLIADVKKWLALPDRISKQVNFLIKRSGKPTTLHLTRKLDSSQMVGSFQSVGSQHWDFTRVFGPSRFSSETELRLMVNANFEFPPIVLPGLQDDKLRKLWGVDPTISTVYELTPWTWLIDWFSGLGSYIKLIDDFHHSDTIINYGFLTYQSKGKLEMDATLKSTSSIIYDIRPGSFNKYDSVPSMTVKPRWSYDYQKRVWLHDVDVHSASKPEVITSSFQKSIILALFGQRLL